MRISPVAANGVVAQTLEQAGISSIRRVVKTPERWDRIVALAAEHGGKLPAEPDSKALNDFLQIRRAQDPDHFADVSLAVIKLMGPGEYVLERPGQPSPRTLRSGRPGITRTPRLLTAALQTMVTQRLIKSVIGHQKTPYTDDELGVIATNCTLKEDAARKVEREMSKRIAAVSMSSHGWGRSLMQLLPAQDRGHLFAYSNPHVEGMLMHGQGVDVETNCASNW